MPAPGHFDGAQHRRLGSSQPQRGSLVSLEEDVALSQGYTQHEPSVGGGGTDKSLQLTCFADVELGNDNEIRRSRSGFLFKLGRGAVCCKSKNSNASHSLRVKPSNTPPRTPPRKRSTIERCYERSSASQSTERYAYGRTTIAALPTRRTHW
jgi:hypothetical protein